MIQLGKYAAYISATQDEFEADLTRSTNQIIENSLNYPTYGYGGGGNAAGNAVLGAWLWGGVRSLSGKTAGFLSDKPIETTADSIRSLGIATVGFMGDSYLAGGGGWGGQYGYVNAVSLTPESLEIRLQAQQRINDRIDYVSDQFDQYQSAVGYEFSRGNYAGVGRLTFEPTTAVLSLGTTSLLFSTSKLARHSTRGGSSGDYGVRFFGEQDLRFYEGANPILGSPNGVAFFMPLDDAALVRTSADALRLSGFTPSIYNARALDLDIYGISFPTDRLDIRLPTRQDTNWPHFLEGGHTAIRLEDPNGGFMMNPTREFVTPGNTPLPTGTVLFRLGPDGEWIPKRTF